MPLLQSLPVSVQTIGLPALANIFTTFDGYGRPAVGASL